MILGILRLHPIFAQAGTDISPAEKWLQANPLVTLGIFVAIFGLVAFVFYRFQKPSSTMAASEDEFRHLVAKSVLFSAIWGLVTLGIVSLVFNSATAILNLLLPVFGTWVGTLLAFYFGKDNFESGARNAERLAKLITPDQRLRSIPVNSVMIPLSAFKIPPSIKGKAAADFPTILLKTVVQELSAERIPIIDPTSGAAIAVIHKSLIDAFILTKQKADPDALNR